MTHPHIPARCAKFVLQASLRERNERRFELKTTAEDQGMVANAASNVDDREIKEWARSA